jgi:putative ABC transport system permease protein
MSWVRRLLNSGARRADIERELTDEVAFHREQQAADLEGDGWAPDAARREAQRRVGLSGTWVAEGVAQDTLPWVSTWLRETGQALRGLGRRPAFLLTATSTLAVGAGVLLAAFTIADAVLTPLPFPDASRLVVLEESINGESLGGNPARTADWNRSLASMAGVAGLYGEQLVLGRGSRAERVQAVRGVGPFADVLQLRPVRGRTFTAAEQRDGEPVLLLTDLGWARLFGRDPNVLDRAVTLRGQPYQVLGILPPALDHPAGTDLIAPAGVGFQRAPRGGNWLQVVGRLTPGATMGRAQDEARGVARRLAETYADRERGLDVRLTSLQDFETRDSRMPVLVLLGVGLVVYLVVCVNVGGLLLVRALSRDHESMVRTALGASRWAMVRLTMHETGVIAAAAMPGAWLVAVVVMRALGATVGEDVERLARVAMGGRTVVAGAAMVLVTTLLLAAWPAWHVATRLAHPRAAAHAVTDAPSRRRVRRALVVSQVACSTLLTVLALLFSTSLRQMLDRPRGFEAAGVIALRYDLDWEQPKTRIDSLAGRVLEVLEATPGVTAVGIVDRFPLSGGTQSTRVRVFGEEGVPADRPETSVRSATPGYFRAMGIPFVAGSAYVDGLEAATRRQVVVNAAFARRYFGATDVVGRRVSVDWDGSAVEWLEIVGVIGDVRQGVRDTAPVPEVYRPWASAFWPLLHVAIRGDGSPDLAGRVRSRLQREVPDQPIAQLAMLDEVIAMRTREPQSIARVMGVCGAAAALLAMIGLYGLLAGELLARRREVGIRLALGATMWRLRAWLVRPGVLLTSTGVALGLAASVPAARALESQLFGVHSDNLATRALAAGALLTAGVLAALIPAWRVVGSRALAALRYE